MAAEKQRLTEALTTEQRKRDGLAERIASLESSLRRGDEERAAGRQHQRRRTETAWFLAGTALLLSIVSAAGFLAPAQLISLGVTLQRAKLLAWTGGFGLGTPIVLILGHRLPAVRSTTWFGLLTCALKFVLAAMWAVFLGVVSTYLWERF